MRVLLAANASYVPPRGGATRSNLAWLDELAACGHECRVVAASLAHDPEGRRRQMESEAIPLVPVREAEGFEIVDRGQIRVLSTADPIQRCRLLGDQIAEFQPDWVLVSSEDLGQLLLREASRRAPGRVVYLAHTPQFYPFGPASWNPDAEGTELVRRAAAVVAIGRHTAQYIQQHAGRRADVIHPPIYGAGPWPNHSRFDSGWITMINPCAVKGLPVFLDVARRLPQYEFAAVPGWGTTKADRCALEALPNVRLVPNVKDIDELLRYTRILLMPSLWYEGFGLIVMEAMLRGIPVVASDSGGLVEAKMGTRFVIPVRGIERYLPVFDEHGMPQPVLEPQDPNPWVEAVRSLLSDRRLYEEESWASREAASRFVRNLPVRHLETFLRGLKPAEYSGGQGRPAIPAELSEKLAGLSPRQRELLLRKLKQRRSGPSV